MLVLVDIHRYKDTKRNEKCPCESGKTFKQCCMKEYREAKRVRKASNAKISCFTVIPSLTKDQKERFTALYTEIMIFSYQYRNESEVVFIDDIEQDIHSFIKKERVYFYKNVKNTIDAYILKKEPDSQILEILDSLKEARLENFFLVSKDKESAVIIDGNEKLYNIRALHSSFDEIFNIDKKYVMLHTTLIPYKDSYITDGIYEGADASKGVVEYLDELPYRQPQVRYNTKDNILAIPFMLNFMVGAESHKFETMEKLILKNIPEDFAKSLLGLLENPYSYKEQLILSFLRSTDIVQNLNSEEGIETLNMVVSGTPIMNFEIHGKVDTISYDVLEKVYKQKPLKESASKSVYENIQKCKKSFFHNQAIQTSFYTMLGITHIDEDKLDDFTAFLNTFNEKPQREKIMLGIDNLFNDLSDANNITMSSVYLGIGVDDLDTIYRDINAYRDYMHEKGLIKYDDMKEYAYRD
jgi:hypothetical protein